jgi:hypothetical protein
VFLSSIFLWTHQLISDSIVTNKERTGKLQADCHEVHERIHCLQIAARAKTQATTERLQRVDDTLKETHEILMDSGSHIERAPINSAKKRTSSCAITEGEGEPNHFAPLRYFKMDFWHYFSPDPKKWLNQVAQFFEYQNTPS